LPRRQERDALEGEGKGRRGRGVYQWWRGWVIDIPGKVKRERL